MTVLAPSFAGVYRPPRGTVVARNPGELREFASHPDPLNIICESTSMADGKGVCVLEGNHHVWARNKSGTKMGFGFQAWNRTNVEFHGLDFSHTDTRQCFEDTALHVSGRGENHIAEDCTFADGGKLGSAVRFYSPGKISRCSITQVRHYAVLLRNGMVRNVKINGVRDPGLNWDGRAEAGLWLEGEVDVDRVWINGARMGVWTGGEKCTGRINNLFVDGADIAGIYHENITDKLLVENFKLGANCRTNIICEPGDDNRHSGQITWRHGEITSAFWKDRAAQHYGWGMWISPGAVRCELDDVKFDGNNGWAMKGNAGHIIRPNVRTSGCKGVEKLWL